MKDNNFEFLKFNRVKLPSIRESECNYHKWVDFGDGNAFPDVLIDLANRSALHNAIISSKVDTSYAEGIQLVENGGITENLTTILFANHPNPTESLNDIYRKILQDQVMFDAHAINVVWAKDGEHISQIYHVPFNKLRSGKRDDHGVVNEYYYCENWKEWRKYGVKTIPAYSDQYRSGSQILVYKSYRPGNAYYPLPTYVGALEYIMIDIEVANFHLSHLLNGMTPTTVVSFCDGEPDDEQKREIKRIFKDEYTGTDNAGTFLLTFNEDKDRIPVITQLSADNLDQQFIQLQSTVLQNILSGHKVVSPMLVGIKTEGQLGGASELRNAYSIYRATVINGIVKAAEKTLNTIIRNTVGYSGAEAVHTETDINWE